MNHINDAGVHPRLLPGMLFVYKSQYSYRILRLVLTFQLPEGLAELEAEQEHRACDGDGIGHGLRQEHGPGLVRQQVGQQIDQRQQQHELPQHRHHDGAGGVADGHEGHLAGDLDAHQEQGPAVDPQHPGGEGHQLRLRRENPGEGSGEQLDAGPQHQGVAQADLQQQTEGLAYPPGAAGAEVIAGDGLGPLGDALQGQHGKLHDAGENGHGPHGQVAAVFQQGGVEAHGDDAFAGLHDEGGGAQGHAGQNQPGPDGQGRLFQPQQGLLPPQEGHHPYAGHRLGQHRGQGRAPDAHVQGEDEQGVQDGCTPRR